MGFLSKLPMGLIGGAAGSLLGPAGAVFGGSIGSSMDNMAAEERNNEANKQQAQAMMAFQERMSSTAHTRATEDLQKAGLNRILALGQPASSPAGAMAQQNAVKNNFAESGMNAASTLLNSQSIGSQTNLNKDSADLAKANTAKAMAETVKIQSTEGIDKTKNTLGNLANKGINAILKTIGNSAKEQKTRQETMNERKVRFLKEFEKKKNSKHSNKPKPFNKRGLK